MDEYINNDDNITLLYYPDAGFRLIQSTKAQCQKCFHSFYEPCRKCDGGGFKRCPFCGATFDNHKKQ